MHKKVLSLTRMVGIKMIKNILRQSFVLFTCCSLAFSPLLSAAQLSLPSGDLVAPKITQEKYVDTVESHKSHEITVTVVDNVAVKQIILYYRVIGTDQYSTQVMQNIKDSDEYIVTIKSDAIKPPGIEYYIQATDLAGNTLLHGYSFSPLSVKTIAAGAVVAASASGDVSMSPEEEDGLLSNKWFWVGIGVLLVGAAAGGSDSGGSGGGTPSATLTVTTDEPVTP